MLCLLLFIKDGYPNRMGGVFGSPLKKDQNPSKSFQRQSLMCLEKMVIPRDQDTG
jgi:hypothetical protein